MPATRFFGFLLLLSFSCDDEVLSGQEEQWDLQEYTMNRSWSCCTFGDDSNLANDRHPPTIFDALLGVEGGRVSKTILSFGEPHTFSIVNDGQVTMRGTMEQNHQRLELLYQRQRVALKILSKTSDTLIIEAEGIVCGPVKVTLKFAAVRK